MAGNPCPWFVVLCLGCLMSPVEPAQLAAFSLVRQTRHSPLSDWSAFVASRQCLRRVMPSSVAYDDVAFHSSEINPALLLALRRQVPRLRTNDACVRLPLKQEGLSLASERSSSYCMAMLWFTALREYAYVMHLDERVSLLHLPTEMLRRTTSAIFAYGLPWHDAHREAEETFGPWLRNFMATASLHPTIPPLPTEHTYSGMLFVSRPSWWLQPSVQRFLHEVNASGGIWDHGWSDEAIRTAALRLHAPAHSVLFLDLDYRPTGALAVMEEGEQHGVEAAIEQDRVPQAHSRRAEENSTGLVTCTDSAGMFSSSRVCTGEDCTMALNFLAPLMGGLARVCDLTMAELTKEAAFCSGPIASTSTGSVLERCPATCATAGVFLPGCQAPATPPRTNTPAQPPALPHSPGLDGFTTVTTVEQLREAIRATPPEGRLSVQLPAGGLFPLGGEPLVIGPMELLLHSEGDGATLDGEGLSRLLDVLDGARVELRSLVLANGRSGDVGGAMRIGRGDVRLIGTSVVNSSAEVRGGAVMVGFGSLTLTASSSIRNASVSKFGGGAISCIACHVRLLDGSSLVDVRAGLVGGALLIEFEGSVAMSNRSFISSATSSVDSGAVHVAAGRFSMADRCWIANCAATNRGGVINMESPSSSVFISNGCVINNSLAKTGGTLYISGGHFTLSASSVAWTSAEQGGAIRISGGSVEISSASSVVDSRASLGGAVSICGGSVLVCGGSSLVRSSCTTIGGSFWLTGGLVRVVGSSVLNSSSESSGGVAALLDGSLVLIGSLIGKPSAEHFGGAFVLDGGSLTLCGGSLVTAAAAGIAGLLQMNAGSFTMEGGSMLNGSFASQGGALMVNGGTALILDGSCISHTSSRGMGGAFLVFAGTLRLTHALVVRSSATSGAILAVVSDYNPLISMTHTRLEQHECASVFSLQSEAQLVLRNLTFAPLPGCEVPALSSGFRLNSSTLGCGDTQEEPGSRATAAVCAPFASCVPQLIRPTPLVGVLCECGAPSFPNPSVSPDDAPYLEANGCIFPRVLRDVYTVLREVSIELNKSTLTPREVNLTLEMQGDDWERPANWSVTNARELQPWLRLPISSGRAESERLNIRVLLSGLGLRERAQPYAQTLLLNVRSPIPSFCRTQPVLVSLLVKTRVASVAWGVVSAVGLCSHVVLSNGSLLVGVAAQLPFTTCDLDSLPVDHSLPTSFDRREPRVLLLQPSGQEGAQVEWSYARGGVYYALITPLAHGVVSLQVSVGELSDRVESRGVCSSERVALADGRCGCKVGFFQLDETAKCEVCAPARASSLPGAMGVGSCDICNEGYYSHGSPPSCVRCPSSASCGWNTTLRTLQLQPGWWRLSPHTLHIYKCKWPAGDAHGSSCSGGVAADALCKPGHTGPLCSVCTERDRFFADGQCHECPDITGWYALLLLLLILPSAWLVHRQVLTRSSSWRSRVMRPVNRLWRYVCSCAKLVGLLAKLKLFVAFTQMLASLDRTYDLSMPELWYDWIRPFHFLGCFDWMSWLAPISCIVGPVYARRQLAWALVPLVLIVAPPLLGAVLGACLRKSPRHHTMLRTPELLGVLLRGAIEWLPLSLLLAFFFTPAVSAASFRAWECTSFTYDELEQRFYLREELSLSCDDDSADYKAVVRVAWVMVMIWPIGMVLLYMAVLFPCRVLLFNELSDSPLVRATAFLHRDYRLPFFWWEVLFLLQRNILSGWLLLIDTQLNFIRLTVALLVCVAFLVALLECRPYKRRSDHAVAVSMQILFVCLFICGMILRLYEDIANHPNGGTDLAYRFLGLGSSNDIVIAMITAAFTMLAIFTLTLVGNFYVLRVHRRLEAKWSLCTVNPPHAKGWRMKQVYACFVSHYKMEAGADARYMHDMLRKMLRAPVFIDSVALTDLRTLFSDCVQQSDVVVLLATKGVLTRPWCLLELLEAMRAGIPVLVVVMSNGGFSFERARHLVPNLEKEMGKVNPEGLAFLYERLGGSLDELKRALLQLLEQNEAQPLVFDSHANDYCLVATLKDIIERMAERTGNRIEWTDDAAMHSIRKKTLIRRFRRLTTRCTLAPRSLTRRNLSEMKSEAFSSNTQAVAELHALRRSPMPEHAVFICCTLRDHVFKHARILRMELSRHLRKECVLGGALNRASQMYNSELCVVLLTRQFLQSPQALLLVYMAISSGIPIVTVAVSNAGYDYVEASKVYDNLPDALDRLGRGQGAEMQAWLPETTTVADVGMVLSHHLTALIANTWSPLSSKHHLHALVCNLAARIPKKMAGRPSWEP